MPESILLVGKKHKYDTIDLANEFHDEFGSDIIIYALGEQNPVFDSEVSSKEYITVCDDMEVNNEYEVNHRTLIKDLLDFESDFDLPVLKRIIYADRHISKHSMVGLFNKPTLYTDHEIYEHIYSRLNAISKIIEKHNPLFIFGQEFSTIAGYLSYFLSMKYEIPFYRYGFTRIKNYATIFEDVHDTDEKIMEKMREIYNNDHQGPIVNRAKIFVKKVEDGKKLYDYSFPTKYQSYKNEVSKSRRYNIYDRVLSQTYQTVPTWEVGYERAKKYTRRVYLDKIADLHTDIPHDEFVYFPLQAQPELSIMVWSPYNDNFKSISKNISQSLPINTKLVTNDHPVQWGGRPISYYRELNSLPGVMLADRNINTRSIIKRANATITVTATAGLESLICRTPVITFEGIDDAPVYSNFDSVQTIRSSQDLAEVYDDINDSNVDRKEVVAYVAAVMKHGIQMNSNSFGREVSNEIRCRLRNT